MPQTRTARSIADIAEDQWGLITRRQAQGTGLAWTTLARLADGGALERIAHGIYRVRGAPPVEHVDLRAAWLQLAPDTFAWERTPDQGVVSHRSAAALYALGHLPADVHEFALPVRRQSRRPDVRLHRSTLDEAQWTTFRGLPVTRPAQIASDLLADREDPAAVAHVIADALRGALDYPGTLADAISPLASRFGLRRGDGLGLLHWLLGLTGDPDATRWLRDAASRDDQRSAPPAAVRR